METVAPQRVDAARTVSLVGHVRSWEEAVIYSKVAGYLEWIGVDLGSWVKEGELLARIDAPELRFDLERRNAESDARHTILQRLEAAQKTNPDMVSQLDIDRARGEYLSSQAAAKRLRRLLAYAEIRAPYDGVITDRWVDPGALVQVATSSQPATARIVRVMRFDTVRVAIDVPEPDCPFLQKGLPSVVRVPELPGREFEGQVARFAWAIDLATRTMQAQIDVANPGHRLRPGMFAQVDIQLEKPSEVWRVPSEALVVDGDEHFVWTVREGSVHRVAVTVGRDDGVHADITGGLTGREAVVVKGRQDLVEGDHVNISKALE